MSVLLVGLLSCALAALAADALLRLAVLAAGLRPSPRRAEGPAPSARFLVLIPAHDEERDIARCVESVRAAARPPLSAETVVVADHCGDRTAEVATGRGAATLARSDGSPGKGEAIGWALARLDLRGFDGVLLLDADSTLDPGALAAYARALAGGAAAAQGGIDVANGGDSWLTRLARLTLRLRFGPLARGRERLGLHAVATGNALLLTPASLLRAPWRSGGLVEGWSHLADLAAAGIRLRFAEEARVGTLMPATLSAARPQRTRWASGRLRLAARRALPLVASGIRDGDLRRAELGLELLRPAPSEAALAAAGVAALAALLPVPAAADLVAGSLAVVLLQGLPYLAVLFLGGPDPADAAALARAPVYLGFKMWAIARGLWERPRSFERTPRSTAAPAKGPGGTGPDGGTR